MNSPMIELVCRDCGDSYYLVGRNALNDTGRCAKCDNEIWELEEKYGPRQVDEWKAFLQVIGALALAGFAFGCLVRVEWLGLRALWRLL
jgi:hypothetical protein